MPMIYKPSPKKKGTIILIKKTLEKKITEATDIIFLTTQEKKFAEEQGLLTSDVNLTVFETGIISKNSVIERLDKETEELLAKENEEFLQNSLNHFMQRMNEFMYVESNSFSILQTDSITLEFDEVFEVYTALFGLSVQKKHGDAIRKFLDEHYHSDKMKYSMMFSSGEGLWEINLPLNYIDGFDENFTILEAYQFLYNLLFHLVASLEVK